MKAVINRRDVLGLGLSLPLLVGCGETSPRHLIVPTPTNTPTPTPLPMSVQPPIWTDAVDQSTGQPARQRTTFSADASRIIAAINVEHVPAGTTFSASWTIDAQPVPEAAMQAQVQSAGFSGWLTFAFTRDADQYFPLGKLHVTIQAAGSVVAEGDVDITVPNPAVGTP